jgi:endoribonuclease Dicer
VARAFASEHARMILQAADSDKALAKICDCKEQGVCASAAESSLAPPDTDTVDDTTEIGFAAAAHIELEKFRNPQEDQVSGEDLEGENFADS